MFLGYEFIKMGDYLILGILVVLSMLATKQILAFFICSVIIAAIIILVIKRKKNKVETTTCTFYEKKIVYKSKDKEKIIEYKNVKDIGYYQTFSQKIFKIGDLRIYPESGVLITSAINMNNIKNIKEEYEKIKEIIQKQMALGE